ncbi:hypothetical protein [uncultured Fibrella sp.]|uniref:hypothetical protein n=1 Tax=uncultured Fibrella sp. TaxID=1284596 RepID=UPI0035CAC8F1
MKTLILSTCLILNSLVALCAPADSLIIRFGNKGRIAVYAPTKDQLKGITRYDLNRIVRDMVTKLDSVPEGQVYAIDAANGQKYLRDTLIVVQKSNGKVTVTVKSDESDTTDLYKKGGTRVYKVKKDSNSNRNNWKVNTDIHFGLNTWIGGPDVQTYGGNSYELDPLGSRYFAISMTQNPAIVRTNKFKLSVRYGLQIAWNNFMFQESVVAQKGPDGIQFNPSQTHLTKSKLTVCNLEIPLVPQFSFYNTNRKRAFNIGVGGFVGYRVDSYTKIKQDNGDKFHDHAGFYLNNLQYGVQGNIGLANFNFFVKYNLNTSFQDGKGPAVHPLSFGITI